MSVNREFRVRFGYTNADKLKNIIKGRILWIIIGKSVR